MFNFRKISSALFVFVFLLNPTAYSQPKGPGNWWMYFGSNKIAPNLYFHNEVQWRNYNFAGNLEQLMLRTGVGYDLSPANNNILLGYAFVRSEPYTALGKKKKAVNEHRIFGQLITKQKFGRFNWGHRYRMEYRNIEDIGSKWRARYFLSSNVPLNSGTMRPGSFYASFYNEIFVNLQQEYFDRNRIYGALGYQITPGIKAEIGYMTQLFGQGHTQQFQIAFFNNLSFSS